MSARTIKLADLKEIVSRERTGLIKEALYQKTGRLFESLGIEPANFKLRCYPERGIARVRLQGGTILEFRMRYGEALKYLEKIGMKHEFRL
jgi:allantoicase